MGSHEKIGMQHGIWIDQQRLRDAGLLGHLEIIVQSGEIRIQSAEPVTTSAGDGNDQSLLKLAGTLSGPPLTSREMPVLCQSWLGQQRRFHTIGCVFGFQHDNQSATRTCQLNWFQPPYVALAIDFRFHRSKHDSLRRHTS